jgi:type IV secretory pathway VirB10-like protein
MADEQHSPQTESTEPIASRLRDRRVQPEGVVPKQSQAYVVAGVAVLILLAALFSKNHPPASKPIPFPSVAPAGEVSERKIEDLNEELNRAQRASQQTTPGASEVHSDGKTCGPASGASTAPLEKPGQQRDPIQDRERELAFKSRFVSNLISKPDSHFPIEPGEGQKSISSSSSLEAESPTFTNSRAVAAAGNKRSPEVNVNAAHGQPYVLFEGTTIDTTLVNRLNGDFSGPVKVLVASSVFSQDRQHVLIPEGTFLLGDVQRVDTFGQRRLAVTFHRMLMPDGYTVDLDRFRGLNQIGETGLNDIVNNHYLQIFGASIALGIISGAAEATAYTSGYNLSGPDAIRQGLASSVSASGTHVLDRFLNILPTITIREGNRIKVYLTQDLLLPAYENHTVPGDI